MLDRQVADLDRRMAEMVALRRELITLKKKADRLPRDQACYCAVIEHTQSVAMTSPADPRVNGGGVR